MTIQKLRKKIIYRVGRTSLGQKVFAHLGRELQPERWIFIVGCYNSGTSLLNRVLGKHDLIASLPSEGVVLTDVLQRPEEFGWTRMWCECTEAMRVEGTDALQKAERIKRQWAMHYPRQVPNLLEKSIANVPRIPFFDQFFRPAYFIYLLRNGYAVAEGIRRKADVDRWGNSEYEDAYPIEMCAEQWATTDDLVQQYRGSVRRLLPVRYEDLAEHPVETVRNITDFLDLSPIDSTKLEGCWGVHGYDRPIENMNPESINRLSHDEMERIHNVVGKKLEEYNYGSPSIYN
jgi:hypothetical protein